MEIYFRDKGPAEVVSAITNSLGGRNLGQIMQIRLAGEDIHVTIKKVGTSNLEFSHSQDGGGHRWELSKEKLALSHRPFKGEIIAKLTRLITQLGGEVV